MITAIQKKLRQFKTWITFRRIFREGIINWFKRRSIQKKILKTSPITTDSLGDIEVRVLTWELDCLNLIWALKSFYFFSEENFPLYIHDGGLTQENIKLLKAHFPNAFIIKQEVANKIVDDFLLKHGHKKSHQYRYENIATRKVFDFFILSDAKRIISIDSDIIFYKKPAHLINTKTNIYNQDFQYSYSMELDQLENYFKIRPPAFINSGLFNVSQKIMNFDLIEKWLNNDQFFSNKWVTEQTIHALSSSLTEAKLLPVEYMIGTTPGFHKNVICKHYPGTFRPLFYQEGMKKLIKDRIFKF